MKIAATLIIGLVLHKWYSEALPHPSVRNVHRAGTNILNAQSVSQQYAAMKKMTEKTMREEKAQRKYHAHLDLIASGDEEACRKLGSQQKWMNLAAEGMTISETAYEIKIPNQADVFNATYGKHSYDTLDSRGFTMLPAELFDWAAYDINFKAIAETMDNLCAAGWPPVFIFLYDQPWKMCSRLFDVMRPLLNDPDAVLEASMYAWALEKPAMETTGDKKEKVGTNFGVPHRDITYKNCHNPVDGSPDILSLWIPVVDVDTDNGCMYVIPRDCDPQFAKDEVPKDQDPFSHRFPYAHVRPLAPAPAGTTLVWHPNLIHWGSSCSASSVLPARKSIAMAFRVKDETRPSTEKELLRYGRLPFTRAELLACGPSYKERLRMIVKALMLYNVWYPEYDGFDIEKLQ